MQISNFTSRFCFALKLLTTVFLFSLLPLLSFSQSRTVSGTVADEAQAPLPDISVTVKGGATGTKTDAAGRFSITASKGATLVFSGVNYETVEAVVGDNTNVSVNLKVKPGMLTDVVVVGYGTQRKASLTGAVSTINADDLSGRPVTNVSTALTGLAPGVFVRQNSGRPGADGASIRIRGITTLNNNEPLVVIDGIIGAMDAVNPDDIQTVSILKDAAAAAIYGASAANGVILITTKKGSRSRTTVTYTGFVSRTAPIAKVNFVTDYARHMRLINEGYTNLGQNPQYPAARIAEWEAAKANPDGLNANGVPNRIAYPNTDWYDVLFTNRTSQNHNVSVSGGSDKLLFLLSANYLNNPGVMNNTGSERYQLRANIEAKINKFITIGTQTFTSYLKLGVADANNAFSFLNQTTPGQVPYLDGKYGFPSAPEESATANNIYASLDARSGKNPITRFNTNLYLTLNLFKGFTSESKVNYQTRSEESNFYANPINRYDFATGILRSQGVTPNLITTNFAYGKDYMITLDQVLRYTTVLNGSHEVGALAGYNEFYSNSYGFNASRLGLIDYGIYNLNSAGISSNQAGGTENDFAARSFFGRINYAYNQKYFLEGVLRYDASSRFASNTRWGAFPSVSAGWRISEENFFNNIKRTIQSLKLRGSWGKLGNNATQVNGVLNNYVSQASYSPASYSFNGVAYTSLSVTQRADPTIQWEEITQSNVGLEATFLKSLRLEFDFYHRQTNGILQQNTLPLVYGTASAPVQNLAGVLNTGIEAKLDWSQRLGGLNFSVGGNFAYNKNEVTKFRGKLIEGFQDINGVKTWVSNYGAVSNNANNNPIIEGHSINELYIRTLYKGSGNYKNSDGTININGGPKDGMIRTPEDLQWVRDMIAAGYRFQPVASVATGTNKALLNYGDFIYADNNGDGIYGSTFDRKFIGVNNAPKFNFGFNLNVEFKGFDLSMLWAGSAGFKYLWIQQGYNSTAIRNGFHILERIADDRYYYNEANPSDPTNNINGKYPRLKNNTDNQNLESSDFWLYDASYIKLKNLQVGYTIPSRITSKASISRARIYFSGENLLLITSYPGQDPEIGNTIAYPSLKQMALGLTVTF